MSVPSNDRSRIQYPVSRNQNLVEKIVQRYASETSESDYVHRGDYVFIRPAHVMTHDNTGAVMGKFMKMGKEKMADPRQVVFALDHNVQDKSKENLEKYRRIEEFAKEMEVDFYPAGRGIGHQILCEEGYAWPGTMVVAADSHSNMYGGLGCLGTPVVRTDAAAIWASGTTWWQVPPVARVSLSGKLRPGVVGKDVIVTLCGVFNHDEMLNHAIEFSGEGISHLSLNDRLTIANMTTEWGALAGLFPVDDVTLSWLRSRTRFVEKRGPAGVPSDVDGKDIHSRLNDRRIEALERDVLEADPDAFYSVELTLDLSTVRPYVSGPDHVKVTESVTEIERKNIRIDKAYLVSCVNSRVEDLAEAAEVVRGRKVAASTEFYIAAASSEVQAESKRRGDWQVLVEAGAIPLPPGCGPCIGLGIGLLEPGEVGISATNRNFKGRMGSREAQAYLASPSVVTASAIAGKITAPKEFDRVDLRTSVTLREEEKNGGVRATLLPGFPKRMEGELVLCHQDNLNTDGIFPGKYTYIDDFTAEQQAQVVMENYDPEFANVISAGDILVGGFNFGTGSSREQAATALKYRGIQSVIAGSYSATYSRNALNNGFLLLVAPGLVRHLKDRFGDEKLTVRTGIRARIDFENSTMTADQKTYTFAPVGTTAQELVLAGGLEMWVGNR
ncbi:MAG: homoaconitase [Candidatus Neomarinimicrobiota bacterium]